MKDDFYPIGTIIKNDNATLMIVGFLPMVDDVVFAYSAVQFPVGMYDDEITIVKDLSDFEIISIGYSDEESEKFRNNSFEIYKTLTKEIDVDVISWYEKN